MEEHLIKALEWYLEDDYRSVEMGILENVEERPAYRALRNYAAQQSVRPTSGNQRGLLGRFWLRVLSALKHLFTPPTRG